MIVALALALALSVQDTSKRAQEDLRDRWVAEDKLKHMMMSLSITTFGYAGMRTVADRDASKTAALSAGIAAGILKEVADRRHHRPFSLRDLTWDLVGVAAGYAVIKQTK